MCLTIASPNSEHFSSLAPSIRRSVIGHGLGSGLAVPSMPFNNQVSRFEPTHVAQHHLCGQDDGAWVHFVLAGVLRRGAVSRFEQRAVGADVGAGAIPMPPTGPPGRRRCSRLFRFIQAITLFSAGRSRICWKASAITSLTTISLPVFGSDLQPWAAVESARRRTLRAPAHSPNP